MTQVRRLGRRAEAAALVDVRRDGARRAHARRVHGARPHPRRAAAAGPPGRPARRPWSTTWIARCWCAASTRCAAGLPPDCWPRRGSVQCTSWPTAWRDGVVRARSSRRRCPGRRRGWSTTSICCRPPAVCSTSPAGRAGTRCCLRRRALPSRPSIVMPTRSIDFARRPFGSSSTCGSRRWTSRRPDVDLGADRFDLIVVTRYLHRPLIPLLVSALAPGGIAGLRDVPRRTGRAGPSDATRRSCWSRASLPRWCVRSRSCDRARVRSTARWSRRWSRGEGDSTGGRGQVSTGAHEIKSSKQWDSRAAELLRHVTGL